MELAGGLSGRSGRAGRSRRTGRAGRVERTRAGSKRTGHDRLGGLGAAWARLGRSLGAAWACCWASRLCTQPLLTQFRRGTGQTPPTFDQLPVFDQQAFAEAVGVTTAAIAQAGIAGRQEDPSNLQRFRAHHPPTFTGGGDSMVADHWFMQIEKVLEAMEITSDVTRIRLAAFQLEGEA